MAPWRVLTAGTTCQEKKGLDQPYVQYSYSYNTTRWPHKLLDRPEMHRFVAELGAYFHASQSVCYLSVPGRGIFCIANLIQAKPAESATMVGRITRIRWSSGRRTQHLHQHGGPAHSSGRRQGLLRPTYVAKVTPQLGSNIVQVLCSPDTSPCGATQRILQTIRCCDSPHYHIVCFALPHHQGSPSMPTFPTSHQPPRPTQKDRSLQLLPFLPLATAGNHGIK